MNQTQEQLKNDLVSHRVYIDHNAENAADILAQDSNGIHPIAFDCISRIEHTIAQVALQSQGEASAAWVIDPKELVGRGGLPIILEPQRRDKHEFETIEHCERAAWAISQFYRTIYPKLPADIRDHKIIREIAQSSFDHDILIADWSLAAYLHDVEKFVESRKVINSIDPSTKNEDKTATRAAILQTPDGKDYKSLDIINTLFAAADVPLSADTSPLPLQSLLHVSMVNSEKVITLFNIYKVVDKIIIEHAQAGLSSSDATLIENASTSIAAFSSDTKIQIMGILLMAADNTAQGVPPIEPPLFNTSVDTIPNTEEFTQKRNAFVAERIRNYDIVVALLRKVLETQMTE